MTETTLTIPGNEIVKEDLEFIFNGLTEPEREKLNNATFLLTGCGGFLGYYFMQFLTYYSAELGIKKIIALDNYLTRSKHWVDRLISNAKGLLQFHQFDVINDNLEEVSGIEDVTHVVHMASVASPTFYRKYPIETVDANITGLRRLLDYFREKKLKGFLFFSSSEIYGDPFPEFIPTKEDYRGNVATTGPRACYDEAKRFGETLCYLFAEKYGMPAVIVRPFNNFGPGMSLSDRRLPADFAKAVIGHKDLEILSDGSPTRTFCYISDAITGYLKALLYGQFDIFNIGTDKPEISVLEFASLFREKGKEIFAYKGDVLFKKSIEKEYLTDNPQRRCPDISKAKTVLGYQPSIFVDQGINRYLKFLYINNGVL